MKHLDIELSLKTLKNQGPLSQSIKGFESREEQQKMMLNILSAYNEGEIALIEAGTGTGKSFAYLIPAILFAAQNKERTVISTHTIALQEQLLLKDIPIILKALNIDLKVVLVKGMGNYVCLRKLEEANETKLLLSENEAKEIEKIDAWNQTTKDGSKSSLPFVPSYETWELVAAESDTCTGMKCPYYQECHFFKARKKAEDAQVLVANHHLLFADLKRRKETDNYDDSAILPFYTRIIIDEAHHIEDIATKYFAKNVNRLKLLRNIGWLAAEKQKGASGKLPTLKRKMSDYYSSKPSCERVSSLLTRLSIDLTGDKNSLLTEIVNTFEAFTEFVKTFDQKNEDKENKLRLHLYHHTHPFWQTNVVPKVNELIKALRKYVQAIISIDQEIKYLEDEKLDEITKSTRFEAIAFANRLQEASDMLSEFISDKHQLNKVRWTEFQEGDENLHLNHADLDIATVCSNFLFSKFPTIVLCSATLTANKQFEFFKQRLGLSSKLLKTRVITENCYGSPFNFKAQSMLLIPTDIPHPQDPLFIKQAAMCILKAIDASHGNAFILFTSYSMLTSCYQLLNNELTKKRYTPFKQGETSRQNLLEKFKKQDRSVLFGTDSFWEGVDVAGEALRLVIIVKLPFKVPSEPIIEARAELINANGGDSFLDYSLPTAIVKFKQGFGRLIRNKKDRGCILCLDSRILNKGYGKHFLDSLPDCQQFFGTKDDLEKEMVNFYKKTYYLTKK